MKKKKKKKRKEKKKKGQNLYPPQNYKTVFVLPPLVLSLVLLRPLRLWRESVGKDEYRKGASVMKY